MSATASKLAGAVALVGFLAAPAYGADYLTLSAGGTIAPNVGMTLHGNVLEDTGATLFHSGTGQIGYSDGETFGLVFGHELTSTLAAEASLDYARASANTFSINLAAPEGDTDQGSDKLSLDATMALAMGNLIWSPIGRGTWEPYIGAGAGLAYTHLSSPSITGGDDDGADAAISAKTWALAANALVGVNWNFSQHWALGLRYRFLWIGNGETKTAGSLTQIERGNFTGQTDDMIAHVLTLGATYRF